VKSGITQSGIEPDSKGAPPRRLGDVGSIFVGLGSEAPLAFVIRIADHERNPPFGRTSRFGAAPASVTRRSVSVC